MTTQAYGKYQLLKKLATGGMAEVFLARQTGIEGFSKLMVVKRILPHLAEDPEFVQMFLNEAKIAARFNHPNIAQIYELGEINKSYFIAMEFIHGEDLGRVMRKAWSTGQWLARPLAIRVIASACEGLYYAHSKTDEQGRPLKVVHRDISPQNLLLSFDGSVKLVDFGIAKAADQASMTKSGAIKGKFAYMAPEQAGGKTLDHRSDIFAIGLVLYELLTGVRPLKRESELATLQAALECAIEPPSQVAEVPSELDDVVMRALAKSPDDRYENARQFQMALEEFLVSQRMVATSVQISELMNTLFADRLEEEAKLGHPEPEAELSNPADAAPAEASANTGSGSRSESKTSAAQMSWEAPPGEDRPSRSGARTMSKGSYSKGEPTAMEPLPVPDVPAWDAPPSVEIPGRRRTGETRLAPEARAPVEERRSPGVSPAPARGTTDPGLRRTSQPQLPAVQRRATRPVEAEAADDERTSMDEVEPQRPAAPPPPRKKVSGTAPGADAATDPQPVRTPAPGRRKPPQTGNFPRRTSSRAEMPEAPPRRVVADDDEASVASLPPEPQTSSDLSPRKRTKLAVFAKLAAVAVVLTGGFVFRDDLVRILGSRASDRGAVVPVDISSNLEVTLFVRHSASENAESRDVRLDGPSTRVTARSDVHAGDTLIISNPRMAAVHEFEVPASHKAGELFRRKYEFKTGYVTPKLKPNVSGVSFWLNDQNIGEYQAGLALELVEGPHTIHARGGALSTAVPVKVTVRANRTVDQVFDLSNFVGR